MELTKARVYSDHKDKISCLYITSWMESSTGRQLLVELPLLRRELNKTRNVGDYKYIVSEGRVIV
jgi:hypothetical protein